MQARRAAMTCSIAASLFMVGTSEALGASMSQDFSNMMGWLSHEMAQGLAFNAGSTFDPPREVTNRKFQPDISLGVGNMPLNKSRFPELGAPALRDMGAAKIFPSTVLFPNLAMHWRVGLPYRSDLSLRFADMTTPPGYKISGNTTGNGQSNSFGLGLRKHILGGGGDWPLLSLGANYNCVFGRFTYKTKFGMNNVEGFSADSDVDGTIQWSINSYGLNAVASQTYGRWTPFAGFGYNYVTGSVRAHLEAISQTPLISPIVGESSNKPEHSQGRLIFGAQMNRAWMNFFFNGEVKAIGTSSGNSWIIHGGITLPFQLGLHGFSSTKARKNASSTFKDIDESVEKEAPAGAEARPEMIFIQ